MSSLTDTAQGTQPMNLHSRVIQSGLDSITGPESDKILLLFSACECIDIYYAVTNLILMHVSQVVYSLKVSNMKCDFVLVAFSFLSILS